MNLLAKVKERPRAAMLASSVVILGVATYALLSRCDRLPDSEPSVIFFDEATGKFSRGPSAQVPPLAGDDGKPTIVRAVLTDESNLSLDHVLYFFRYAPDAKHELEEAARNHPQGSFELMLRHDDLGKEVRLPQAGSKWFAVPTPEGQRIINGASAAK